MNSTTYTARRSGRLETLGIPKKHLDIHINQKVMNGELVLYPHMYPFLQQLRVDYSGRTGGGAGAERAIPHSFAQLML